MLIFLVALSFQLILVLANDDARIFTGIEVCQAYQNFEKTFKCGKDGYFLGYGERYCKRFFDRDLYSHFDDKGKKFVQCTGKCLVDELQTFLRPNPRVSCPAIENKAFGTHVDCYLKCGFCETCKTNKDALRRIYEFRDFLTTRAIETVEKVLKKCGGIIKGGLSCLSG